MGHAIVPAGHCVCEVQAYGSGIAESEDQHEREMENKER